MPSIEPAVGLITSLRRDGRIYRLSIMGGDGLPYNFVLPCMGSFEVIFSPEDMSAFYDRIKFTNPNRISCVEISGMDIPLIIHDDNLVINPEALRFNCPTVVNHNKLIRGYYEWNSFKLYLAYQPQTGRRLYSRRPFKTREYQQISK